MLRQTKVAASHVLIVVTDVLRLMPEHGDSAHGFRDGPNCAKLAMAPIFFTPHPAWATGNDLLQLRGVASGDRR